MIEKNIIVGAELERLTEFSLGEILYSLLKTHADRILQVDAVTEEELSASLLLSRAIKFSKWLQSKNIGVGDSVSVISENRLEFCIVPIAALFVGATFAPLNPEYTHLELNHVLSLSKPKVVVCSENVLDKLVSARIRHSYIRNLVVFGNRPVKHKDVEQYENIISGATADNIDESFIPNSDFDCKEVVATVLCSSGTTGMPKGVMTTHDNMTTFMDVSRSRLSKILDTEADKMTSLGLVPFFHSMGFMIMFLQICAGNKLVVINKFSPKVFLRSIEKYKIRLLAVPPPVLTILIKNPLVKQYDLSSITDIRSGAAPMGKEMEAELRRRYRLETVLQSYGMTETTLAVLANPEGNSRSGSVGLIVPGMMAKIIDENGKALGPYEEGELCFKGPLIMKGYIGDPEATANTIDKDKWLHTGDVGYYDKEGYFFIVDRLKELIKYKAFQVAPAELEALLLTHPAVDDVAVVGLPDEDAGELPIAFVVKRAGFNVTGEELQKFVADNVSSQKKLRGGVKFIDEIPRNPTGKILRRVLRDRIMKPKSKL